VQSSIVEFSSIPDFDKIDFIPDFDKIDFDNTTYGVATVSRLLKSIRLFCRISSLL